MNDEQVAKKLQSIGMAVFTKYFHVFKSNADGTMTNAACINHLVQSKVGNEAGSAIRCGSARALFNVSKERDALILVTKSGRVPLAVVRRAEEILANG
jgi:hypothetical protein